MSNEYKMLNCPFCGELPIITKHHREEMYNFIHRCEVLGPISRDFREDPMAHVEMWNTRFAAAPQPPALGGEPEVLGWSKQLIAGRYERAQFLRFTEEEEDFCRRHGIRVVELIDRAHLAPLQAEIERLKDNVRWKAVADQQVKVIDQLKAQRDELEALLKDCRWRIVNKDVSTDDYKRLDKPVVDRIDAALSKPAGSEKV